MMGPVIKSRPPGDAVFDWIPACAGMTKGGAGTMPFTGHPCKLQDTHVNYRTPTEITWVSCLLYGCPVFLVGVLLWGGAVAAQETPVAGGPFCPVVFQVPERPRVDVEMEEGDTYLNADSIDLTEKGISRLSGSVEMSTDAWQARADGAVHNDPGNFVDLSGDVKFWEESLFLNGARAHIDVDESTATVSGADYYLPDNNARGSADELFIDPGILTSGKDMSFTTCAPENGGGIEENFWRIDARELHLDHEAARGSGRDIVLRIKDVPVFYSPYFTFPLSRERKSGFLAPGIGKNSHGGFETRLPYYWNIAPDMDATITPRALANSGVMGMLEYRYLRRGGNGRVSPGIPARRRRVQRPRPQHDQYRTQPGLPRPGQAVRELQPGFGPGIPGGFRRGAGRFQYPLPAAPGGPDLPRPQLEPAGGRLHSYQIVDQSIAVTSRPYKNLPRLQFRYRPLSGNKKINLNLLADFTYFDRTGEAGVTVDVTGFRADLYPSVSYPIRTQAAFLAPKVGVRFTRYELDKQGPFTKSPGRTLPIVSVDSGVFPGAGFPDAGPRLPAHAGTAAVLPVRAVRGPGRPAGIRFVRL